MDLYVRRKLGFIPIISKSFFFFFFLDPRHSLVLRQSYRGCTDPPCQSNLIPYREQYADNARTEYDKDLAAIVLADQPSLVVCAGWMSILADTFLDPIAEANVPIINLHPALPVSRGPCPFRVQPGLN